MSDKMKTAARGATCRICGAHTSIWLGPQPAGCLYDGGSQICQTAIDTAYGAAMRRKVCPEAFDANGVMLPGALPVVCNAMIAAGLHPMSGRPA